MNQIQVPTSNVTSWVQLAMAFMVPLSVHVTLLTQHSLDTRYRISFRKLSITHSSLFLVDHSISRISTQQRISRNLFNFGPMLTGTFLLNYGWEITRRSLWHRFWDICMYHQVFTKKIYLLPTEGIHVFESCLEQLLLRIEWQYWFSYLRRSVLIYRNVGTETWHMFQVYVRLWSCMRTS